jgi:hypothetical protein
MIHATCQNSDCENHGQLVEVEAPKVGTVSSRDIAASPGLRMDAGYHLARQAPCPKCNKPLGEFDELRLTVRVRGLTDAEVRESAAEAIHAGDFELTGSLTAS